MKKIAKQDEILLDKSASKEQLPFSIDPTVFTQKPTKKEIAKLSWQPVNGSVINVLHHATSGRAFTCGVFKDNHRESEKLIKQQIFCVDFDGGMTLNEAGEILKEYNLFYNAGYYSFRHSAELEKFRLLFVFDGEIQDPKIVKSILRSFYYLFQCKSDKSCVDAARYWNGTDKDYFIGDINQVINLKYFSEVTTPLLLAADRNQYRKIVTADEGILCAKSGKIIYNINKENQGCTNKNKKDIDKIQNFNIEDLQQFQLFKIFFEGKGTNTKNKLSHHELFGIATNLIHLKGGYAIWKECLAKNPLYPKKEKESIYKYVYDKKYDPIHFSKFSPYEEDKTNFFQTFRQILIKKGRVFNKSNGEEKLWKLADARAELAKKYNEILEADDCNIYIIKCATGLGKTQLIKNTTNIVAAFPDHSLKLEHFNDSELSATIKLATPAAVGFSENVQKHIDAVYRNGFNDVVNTLIKNLAAGLSINDERKCSPEDIKAAQEYLDALRAVKESNDSNTVFTTHHRAVLTWFPQPTIIFDENPLGVLLAQGSVPISDVQKLILEMAFTGHEVLAEKLRACVNSDSKTVFDFVGMAIDEDGLYKMIKKLKLKSKIWEFLKSDYYVKINDRINYCTNNIWRLPTDKKIIIADATAPIELYRKMLGSRLKEFDISNVELKGKIIQYTTRSCSRTGNQGYSQAVNADLDDWDTITYKSQKHMFDNSAPDIHFGKSRGTNKYEGRNLNVIGTPNYGSAFYMFLAKVCGLDVSDFKMKNRKVLFKNNEFVFYTVAHEELQEFHLELTEGDIIQAAHRARPINHDVIVKVYSNLPIPHAELIWWKKNTPNQ
ncbi:hypothetical protein [Mucilaginibacter phyllosphaerae]|uniref:Uncharacterized protein n=1 Tax=Mucilaginibacter phyllosphaerae TaxID=1812349 RepID=A0A4Y8ABF4_9SPHI|nr:hypothetical protein [Mucilaginibacter phyllosphaerae]MBB3969393.1 hypothetical protein [Mucilaginibacter phyllosphaerae]TEW65820.1 hypothetical protein E2R65_11825 [Mucilaginibacter phyllosphaerae]GGH08171.1 hypothetical protein GCM10007352_13230 [Mucilaginibacter phyllosphaerae]